MEDLRPEPWIGMLWFGFFALIGFGVAWGNRRFLAQGRTPGHSTPTQQRIAMYGFFIVGLVAGGLVVREAIRWIAE